MIKEVTEQELAEKSVAPRVTKAQIDSLMERVTYTVEQRPVARHLLLSMHFRWKVFPSNGF